MRAETQAEALAERLGERFDTLADVVFDAGDGFYRVRIGGYAAREEAEAVLHRLTLGDLGQAQVVSEPGKLERPALEITHQDRRWIVPGRWLEVHSTSEAGHGVPVLGSRYRGELLVYLNDRGKLNLINRVSLDDYLRGVVPREMGPELYGDLEALKAQAVAARTYTLRNLGEFSAEGFDICATPRCQVYGGIDSEHPISDRAVLETSGEVLLDRGGFADALYSSTCGGHTENVEVVFPLKEHAYLRGVPCLESGVGFVAGAREAPGSVAAAVVAKLLPDLPRKPVLEDFVAAARSLAARTGRHPEAGAPGSKNRREINLFLAALLGISSQAPALATDEELARVLRPPADWDTGDLHLAAQLLRFGLVEPRLDEPIGAAELTHVLFRVAVHLRLVERLEGRYLALTKGRLTVRHGGREESWELPPAPATFRLVGGRLGRAGLRLLAGDPVVTYASGSQLLVLVQEIDGDSQAPALTEASWRHFRSDQELVRLVGARYPGLRFRGFDILSRGVSGRVAALRLLGEDGGQVEVAGLPIRWTLDLPDTRFTARRATSATGEPGWLFSGRGLGHGVGMCQVGAYGMGLRGHRYADILDHYYTGLELRRLPLAAPVSRRPT